MVLIVPVLLVLSAFCLALGLVLPLVRFEKLYVFKETPSLVDLVLSLWTGGNVGLAALVALFSIVFPAVKLVGIAVEATARDGEGALLRRLLPLLSKWSMMDVMLVAIVIAAAKTSGLADAFSEAGLWCYAGATVMTTVLQWTIASGKAR